MTMTAMVEMNFDNVVTTRIEMSFDKKIRIFEAVLDAISYNKNGDDILLSNLDAEVSVKFFIGSFRDFDSKKKIRLRKIENTTSDHNSNRDSFSECVVVCFDVLELAFFERTLEKLKMQHKKRQEPLLRKETVELLARKFGDLTTETELINHILSCGVEDSLIVCSYSDKHWKIVYRVLNYLCNSAENCHLEIIKRIIKKFILLLINHEGGRRAEEFERKLDEWFQNDGFRIINGELIDSEKITEEARNFEGINKQILERETQLSKPFFTDEDKVQLSQEYQATLQKMTNENRAKCKKSHTDKMNDTLKMTEDVLKKFKCVKKWEHISFEFLSEQDRVEIIISNDVVGKFHFDDIGFSSKRHNEMTPVKAWRTLKELSLTEGKLCGNDASDRKRDLKKRLEALFSCVSGDPFEKKSNGGFEIKLKVLDKHFHREQVKEMKGLLR